MPKHVKIIVDCERNDPVDQRAGGPQYLGYDFFAKQEDRHEIMQLIIDTIKAVKQPFIDVKCEDIPDDKQVKLWTKEQIVKCIHMGYK